MPSFAVPVDGGMWPPPPIPPGWVGEVKLDGWRAFATAKGDVFSRSGGYLDTLPFQPGWRLDGEWWGGRFVAFDLMVVGPATLLERRELLEQLLPPAMLAPRWDGDLASLPATAEGVVYKRLASRYRFGPTSDWIKYRRRVGTGGER